MKLYTSTGSPFVRKCRIVLREKGLEGRVDEVALTFPYQASAELLAANPIGQVPALVLEDGQTLANSPVICAYLDTLGSGPRLVPPEGAAHWQARRLETLADAILEMTVKIALEGRRPQAERSAQWLGWWTDGLNRALDQAEAQVPDPESLDIGKIALAVAGPYIDLRMPTLGWRAARPRLSAFCDALDKRPSFAATRPS
jgi:glutathione S-transferase